MRLKNGQLFEPNPNRDKSPLIVGPPITQPRHFFGRENELKRLFTLWRNLPLQNAAIIGPRRSGKTSLLYYLKTITTTPLDQLRPNQRNDWLPQPERYRWVYVDFQDPRLKTQAGLLQYLLTGLQLPTPRTCNLETFMDTVSLGLRNPTIILMDEIGVALQRYPELDDSFWESLRSLATNQVNGNLAFVLASHETPVELAHHSGHSSPFFNIFGYTAFLAPLNKAEARELIASSPISFPRQHVEWILKQSRCWPILLNILCRERLAALEEGQTTAQWRKSGVLQMKPFQSLLEGQ
jgi:hypothetical protein